MRQYLDLLQDILENGKEKSDRTGVGTKSVFGRQMRFDSSEGFPLVTTKKVHLKSVIYELLWFVRGDTNVQYLLDHGVSIWNEWADENGDLGPIYGCQWRSWKSSDGWDIDQLEETVERIRTNPDCRRLIVSAWNAGELRYMSLAPCHLLFQFYVVDSRLSVQVYQRSADLFLGVPFNLASYSLLLSMIARMTGLQPGELVWTGGDCHIYLSHLEQVQLQLTREPLPLPTLELVDRGQGLDDWVYEDFKIVNYQHHPAIKAPVAV